MNYSNVITRKDKGCFLLALDQSFSMSDPFGGDKGISKAIKLAEAVNNFMFETCMTCTKDESGLAWDYFDVGVLVYGGNVGSAFQGNLSGRKLVSISEIAQNPARMEERMRKGGDGKIRLPIWVEAVANGETPMCHALQLAFSLLSPWVSKHPDSFPPVVLNVSDGEATDGSPLPHAQKLMSLSTNDGNVLVYNLHISSNPAAPVLFPEDKNSLPADPFCHQLFEMSSKLPPHTREFAAKAGFNLGSNARGFVFNASIDSVISFLKIGTTPKALC